MMFKRITILFIFFNHLVCANPALNFSGTFTRVLNPSLHQKISLMKVHFTPEIQATLKENLKNTTPIRIQSHTPIAIQLGMNGVPVSDQGPHGSCVTFAAIGAINAIKGQAYSELCSLSLGQYIAQYGYQSSGWDGQIIRQVLSRLDDYGIVPLEEQKTHACGGMTEYPEKTMNISQSTSPEEYQSMSISLNDAGLESWSNFYDINQWLHQNIPTEYILQHTKSALRHHHRVLIGVLIPGMFSHVGALGQHHMAHDSWVLTSDIQKAIQDIENNSWLWGGHAMIITGYDDEAIAIDEQGQTHQGLLTLRNSWGSLAGDHGDYYMSYDYFSHLAVELTELHT